ncbi:MAG: alanine racemase [Methylococcaceae bacterium]|nr:alanine racemase [Methylococcaceae bacterium]MDZ4155779.1 alanine racemase [Methylococcales bacterium]MDP2391872.1 alanine racemase [Methylococcaceae bacterium]MDP3018889.1 alanine racemase [Methylococcaceae bacterium]MDP3391450.1 alanine racemase [Methylococcaceae bacterium]
MTPAAYAVLNLDAVQHNLAKVRDIAPNAKIMAVIKANGYGHGLLRIAEALQGVDAFAVARVDEGIRLRKAGFQNRIAVLEGFTCCEELDDFLEYRLDAIVHCDLQIELLAARNEYEQLAVWLKLDSGMNRLGFKAKEFAAAYQRLEQCPIIKRPINLITHFANADDKNDPKTQQQIDCFNTLTASYPGERSMANSAGILGWPSSITDWVRPGVLLYGISPFADITGDELGLKPVMELHSRLIAVKQLEQGDSVGYSGSWICQQPTTLGVVAIGYGDGYPRYAKIGTPVLVNGQRVPLIGRISMDMLTVDLASQPQAKPGDPVTLWGNGLPIEEIARCADTIPYTLVCGITPRVQIVED